MDDLNLSKPVACTPTSPEQRAQTARLKADLAPQVLEREQLSDGVRLRFALSPEMRAQIERLVTFDKGCCDYLEHRIASSAEGLTLTVRSQGQGIEIAQNFLSLGTDKNSKPRGKLKVFALLGVCGLACSAPLLLAAAGIGAASISLAAVGKELAVLGLIAMGGAAYFLYARKKRAAVTKGKSNADRCGC
ncbi:MAG: hypothetical protein ACJA2X_000840 [Halocynthiibacter sp.]|jgi:hypothetical protein